MTETTYVIRARPDPRRRRRRPRAAATASSPRSPRAGAAAPDGAVEIDADGLVAAARPGRPAHAPARARPRGRRDRRDRHPRRSAPAASPPCSRWPTPTRSPTPPARSSRCCAWARRPGYVDVQPVGAVTVGLGGAQLAELGAMADERRAGAGLQRRRQVRARRRADAPRAGVREGVRRRGRAARAGAAPHRGRADERGRALRRPRAARLARGRRGGDHRARRAARRARRIAPARLPRLDRRLGRDHPLGQGARGRRHRRGRRRTTCCSPTSSSRPTTRCSRSTRRCAPRADVQALREALADGTIDVVATDHAPHPVEDKDCEWSAAAMGMLGLETALGVVAEAMVEHRPARLGRRRRPHVDRARRASAGSPATAVRSRSASRPTSCSSTLTPARTVVAAELVEPQPQHAVRRTHAAGAGWSPRSCAAEPTVLDGAVVGRWRVMTGCATRHRLCSCSRTAASSAARAYGAVGETFGEAVFTTGMTGYQETLTDPSYHRQVVVQTAPHIGNYGVNDDDAESRRIWVAGYVVRDPSRVVVQLARAALARRRPRRAGRRRHQRRRHPRAHPPPARARRDARRRLQRRRRPPSPSTSCSSGCARARRCSAPRSPTR